MIIEELKEEHKNLVAALETIDINKIGTEEGNNVLFSIKEALLAHLNHEDTDFYPKLKEVAQSNEKVDNMLDEFEADLKKITDLVLDFFNKYTSSSVGDEFTADFKTVVEALTQRIEMEETMLFDTYKVVVK